MEFGELPKEINKASNVEEAIAFVRRACDIEYELHCILCALCGHEPHGKRGYSALMTTQSALTTMADCVTALDSHAKKIEEYATKINSHEAGLEHFNKTIGRVQQAYDSVSHMLPSTQGARVQELPRARKPWWKRE